MQGGKNLDDYEFYPFDLDEKKNLFFDVKKFNAAVTYFISKRDNTAARQLILIGEQNNVEGNIKGPENTSYKKLYKKYDGDKIIDDTVKYLENYKRIVRLMATVFQILVWKFFYIILAIPPKRFITLRTTLQAEI